jgi:predicted nucleic acid-binding protein
MDKRGKPPLAYLDTSALGRVLDDYTRLPEGSVQQAFRGRAAHAAAGLLSLAESGLLQVAVSSHALQELRAAPGGRLLALRVRELAFRSANVTLRDRRRAAVLAAGNLSAPDALHMAIAERIGASVLITCDKGLLAGAKFSGIVGAQDLFEWMRDEAPEASKEISIYRAGKRPRQRR